MLSLAIKNKLLNLVKQFEKQNVACLYNE